MATSDYWSSADLKAIAWDGLIREDVMNQIWDISNVPLPFTDLLSSDTCKNSYAEWTLEKLATPDTTNALVDGQDMPAAQNNTTTGSRVGNQCQISGKQIMVTERAQSSDVIGRANELAHQIEMAQKNLRRDREAIYLTQQASVADNGNATAGKLGGFGAWLTSNVDRGATGANGGFASGVVAAPTVGTTRALSETTVRDIAAKIWTAGGNPSVLMSVPLLIRRMSEYMFTSSARIATMMTDVGQKADSKVAQGSVNVFVTDFGVTLEMVANRLMQPVTSSPNRTNLYFIDPMYARESFIRGYEVEPLGKAGLADKRMLAVDGTLKVLNEEAHGVIADLDWTLAMVS